MSRLAAGFALALTFTAHSVHARDVGYAGFSYAGDFQSIESRFPLTSQVIPPHGGLQAGAPSAAERQLLEGVRHLQTPQFNITVDSLTELEGRDEAVMVVLEITDETVSTERFDDVTKLFINLRAQALFFDFKSRTVLRAYPVSAVYLGALHSEPTGAAKLEKVRELIVGGVQPGLIGQFLQRLARASLPQSVSRFIGVTNVVISPDAMTAFPEYFSAAGVSETWLADQFSETLLDESGVSLLPYSKGYAIGNTMSAHLADGTAFNLKIPPADYAISIDLVSLKKVLFGEVPAGRSFIYGTFAHLLVEEPLSQHRYFDAVLKNGETKLVPASQATLEDWPAFQDSITGLFKKFSVVAAQEGADEKWIRSSTSAPNLTQQVSAIRTVLKSCH